MSDRTTSGDTLTPVTMAHRVRGDGPPLLLLAGTGYNGGTWPDEMVESLAQRFSVVTFDYRGTGETPGTPEDYTTRLFAADVRALIEELGRGPAHVLGHSMGGRVAQWVAIDGPDLVRSLVFASTGPGEFRPGSTQYTGIPPAAAEQMIERGYEGYMRYQIETTFFTVHDHATRKDVVEELIRAFWAGRPSLHDYLKHVAARQGHRAVDRIGEIRQPSLVLVGDADTHAGGTGPHLDQARHLADAVHDARLEVISGSAHGYFWTQAPKVMPSVIEFLGGGRLGLMARHQFSAVNLISDPIHGYVELTKRLTRPESSAAELPDEDVAEEDLLDTTWLQRLRRISQLQSARWVFPTAEHSRFTHGLGVMHEAGLWARALYPSLRSALGAAEPGASRPSEGLVVETLRIAGLLHDVGHGPFAHFFDDHVLAAFPAPADPRRVSGKRLSHEDLSQLIIERELELMIRGLRRAPGAVPERDAFGDGEAIDPRWVSYLISKPALADAAMPRWVRWLQPLLSGVFTVDNLDYVRRDAYLIGVAAGPVDVERLRRYAFISERGLTLYEPALGALGMFLTARLFMYQEVYFHRTVRAIDLDLAEVFGPSVRAIFGKGSPADRLGDFADLDEYALLHQAARWARGEQVTAGKGEAAPGTGRVSRALGDTWRGILLRQPRWRSEREIRVDYEDGGYPEAEVASLGTAEPGRVAIDLAIVDARPPDATATDSLLAIESRDGHSVLRLSESLGRLPAYALIGRRYRRG